MNAPSPRSEALLRRLQALPRLVVPATVLLLALIGLMGVPILGIPALVVVLAFVWWLAALSWFTLDAGGRVLRVVVVGLLIVVLASRVMVALQLL